MQHQTDRQDSYGNDTSMENIAFFKYKNTVVMESVKFKQLFYELMCIELS